MSSDMIWFAFAGLWVLAELFTGTFYLLMIAVGFAFGGVVAQIGQSFSLQILAAAFVSALLSWVLSQTRFRKPLTKKADLNPDIFPDIGQTLEIFEWQKKEHVPYARSKYSGAMWEVALSEEADQKDAIAGRFVIVGLRANTLIVKPYF